MNSEPSTALAVIDSAAPVMGPEDVRRQVQVIQQVMHKVMQRDQHYGLIPGCGDQPTLLHPGAQKIALVFGYGARYEIQQTNLDNGHREYSVRCRLMHIRTGTEIGEGVGCASTMEGRYRYRTVKTPTGEPIPDDYRQNKGAWRARGFVAERAEDGWVWCRLEKVEHDNPADYYNTVLKMAKKRAYVDAVLTATAASDIFTQDLEDDPSLFGGREPEPVTRPPQQRQQQTRPASQQRSPGGPDVDQANNGVVRGMVQEVRELKRGTNKNGEWVLYGIVVDGETYATFRHEHATIAGEARDGESPVAIHWARTERGKTCEDIEHAGADTQGPSADGTPDAVQSAEAVITSVEPRRAAKLNGRRVTVMAVETSVGRMGIVDDEQLMAEAERVADTGTIMEIGFINTREGRQITSLTESDAF